MGSTYFERDMGLDKFLANMTLKAGDQAVMVGFLQSAGNHKGTAITMAQLAAVHEFGTQDGRIPERAFMRSALAGGADKLTKLAKKLSVEVAEGSMTLEKALGLMGQKAVDLIKAKIAEGVPPPNAASTIRAKGSDKTLVDTGQLLNSVHWELRKGGKR